MYGWLENMVSCRGLTMSQSSPHQSEHMGIGNVVNNVMAHNPPLHNPWCFAALHLHTPPFHLQKCTGLGFMCFVFGLFR